MVIRRGEIWWATLGEPSGSEPGYRRPLLVVQSNDFNASRISTVLVAVITGNLHLAEAPGNVKVPRKQSKLRKDSVVNVSQLLTVDEARLGECVSKLPERVMFQVDAGLRLVLGL